MAQTQHLPRTDPPRSPRETLPTMYDLPSEDPEEPGLPDEFHYFQPQLLRETFQPPRYPAERVFVGSDLNLYYNVRHPTWHKRPDWFAVLGVPRLYDERDLRLSFVAWQEDAAPYLVVELLSPGTEKEDLGGTVRDLAQPPTKWTVYEQILRIPYYVVFSRYTDEARYFELIDAHYREVKSDRLWLPEAELGLGLWTGTHQGLERRWLRFCDANGAWIPTTSEQDQRRLEQERRRVEQERRRAEQQRRRADQEQQRAEQERQHAEQGQQRAEQERQRAEQEQRRAEQERQRAEQEQQRAEQERQRAEQEQRRAERLAEQLRALGIEPER